MKLLTFLLTIIALSALKAQNYSIDARLTPKEIMSGHLKMGNPGPAGKEILLNNKYMTLGGRPIIPVMGEIHYSRVPEDQWEDRLLKMKANGINIIATYVFWIHHEEIEGQFDWSGNKDFRSFIKLCQKHGLWVYPRIGPWCHGEVRNGGTPDWIFGKKNIVDRSNHPVYQFYADRLYNNIAMQMHGLYYKDGGPIIGIQLENEYRRGPGGNEHIIWLKQTAIKYGMDVPMYTVTGWGNASVPQDEVIPLFGGYPEEPWDTNLEKMTDNPNFTFEAPINNDRIGADVVGGESKNKTDHSRYPYFTCEIGVGNQISYHRRPILNQYDGLAIVTAKTGSGSNMPGYYVFAGGSNPVGIYTTMEENQDETGYWNEYPDISYDFQAAIKETGELASSYHQVKKFHYFINEFGSRLAVMLPVLPQNQKPQENIQWALRVKENSGFLFGMNYYRGLNKPVQKGVKFTITLPSGDLFFPSKPVNVPDSCIFIWPFNFDMEGITLKYATAQPLCTINQKDRTDWFFIQNLGITPEFCFDAADIEIVEADKSKVKLNDGKYLITDISLGVSNPIKIKSKSGKIQHIIVLSFDDANHIWLFNNNGEKQLYISDANLYLNTNTLHIYSSACKMNLISLHKSSDIFMGNNQIVKKPLADYFSYQIELPEKKVVVKITKKEPLDDAQWLKISVKEINRKNQLYHIIYIKEFNLDNPSPVKSATFFMHADISARLLINKNWYKGEIKPNEINQIDLTGYLQTGANTIMADFPVNSGETAFSGKIIIEYFNADRVEIITDNSWLTAQVYILPAPWGTAKGMKAPEVVPSKAINYSSLKWPVTEWKLSLPDNYMDGLSNIYLHVNYTADIGRCYLGHRLVSDNFYNGTPWQIELKQFGNQLEGKELDFYFTPLQPGYKIYLEKNPQPADLGKIILKGINVIPEYAVDVKFAE